MTLGRFLFVKAEKYAAELGNISPMSMYKQVRLNHSPLLTSVLFMWKHLFSES